MKIKIYFLIFSVILSVNLTAQWGYGIKTGLTISSADEGVNPPPHGISTAKYGFQAGVFVSRKMSKLFGLQSGMQLTQKGFKKRVGAENTSFYWYRNASLTFLEIPVEAIFHLPLAKSTALFTGGGAVPSLGVFGNTKGAIKSLSDGVLHVENHTDHHPFSGKEIQAFDLGADVMAGLRTGKIIMSVCYTHGLLNTRQKGKDVQSLKNRSFAVAFGCQLGGDR